MRRTTTVSLLPWCRVTRTCASALPLVPLTIVADATRAPAPRPTWPAVAAVTGPTQRVLVLPVSTPPMIRETVVTTLM